MKNEVNVDVGEDESFGVDVMGKAVTSENKVIDGNEITMIKEFKILAASVVSTDKLINGQHVLIPLDEVGELAIKKALKKNA